MYFFFFFFQAEDGIRDKLVTGVQTCALPICGDHGERDDGVRARGDEICAETRRDDGGDYVEPAHAGGAAGEDRDFAGGGAGSVDRIDETEGGDVAKDGAEHAEHGGDGAAGTCV